MGNLLQKLQAAVGKRPVLSSILLIFACLLLFYSNSFTAGWHYDDFHHIKENINIRKVSNIPQFFTDPSTFSRNPNTRMYRPLLITTLALNYQAAISMTRDGYHVVGYHVVNFIFHLASSFLVFFVVLFLFRERVRIPNLDPHLPAAFAGLLFGLNTINTETVVYISSRSSGMSTMFVMLSFLLYLTGTRDARPRVLSLLASAVLFFFGMLSKEEAITLAAMLLYYELLLNRSASQHKSSSGFLTQAALRLAPHAVAAFSFLAIRHAVLRDNLLSSITTKGGTAAAPHLTGQLATQTRAWVFYFREWLWPTGLSIDKPFRISLKFIEPSVLFSLVVIAAILSWALWQRRKRPVVTFGLLWWFTALLPTSLIRLNVPINDHRLYLPGPGMVLVFAYVAGTLYVRFRSDSPRHLRLFVSMCAATILFMGLGTYKRNMAFATEETIWKDVILKDSKSVRGFNNLGIYYEQSGDLDKAIKFYNRTVQLAPFFPNPYINLGNVYHKQKDYEKADRFMKQAIKLDPVSALANYNLGNILREWGKEDEAIAAYKRALFLNPRYIEAANNMANIFFKNGQFANAAEHYKKALDIDPTFAMSYYNLGLALENLRDYRGSIESFERFLRYWLGDASYFNLAQRKITNLQWLEKQSQAK